MVIKYIMEIKGKVDFLGTFAVCPMTHANAQRTIAEVSAEFNKTETKRLQDIERKGKEPTEGKIF